MNPAAIEQRNIQSVQEQVVCLNAHEVDCFLQFLAPSFVWRSDLVPEPHQGLEQASEGLRQIFSVFPDIHFQELALYPGGEAVTGVFEVSGTEIRPGPGSLLPPVHNHPWRMNQAIIHTFDAEGKMTMVWLFANVAALMQQLGMVPQDVNAFGAAPGQRLGDAYGAAGFDPWHPTGLDTGSGAQPPYADDPSDLGALPRSSLIAEILGLPVRLLETLLVALERSLGIGQDNTWPADQYGSGESSCVGCGG